MKQDLKLLAGEWVEVRSREEILATLDQGGRLDKMPFMPEMLQFCGKRFQVFKRAHKSCDTVNRTGGIRLFGTSHLEGARCTGEAHGGCQAGCLLFWKDAWLKRVDGLVSQTPVSNRGTTGASAVTSCNETQLQAATRVNNGPSQGDPTFVCQATQLPLAATPLPWWELSQYVEDYSSGNVSLGRIVCGMFYMAYSYVLKRRRRIGRLLVWLYDHSQKVRGGYPYPRRCGSIPATTPTPSAELNLQPGELVRVKSYREILLTLNSSNKNRGMFFDAEEVPYCGKVFRVKARVNQIIDERTGKMLKFKSASVILEGAFCQSRYSEKRLFCPRAIYPFWREIWLERLPGASVSDGLKQSPNSKAALVTESAS